MSEIKDCPYHLPCGLCEKTRCQCHISDKLKNPNKSWTDGCDNSVSKLVSQEDLEKFFEEK